MTIQAEPVNVCRTCDRRLALPSPAIVRQGGRRREFCSDRCRKAAHRQRVRAVRLAAWAARAQSQGADVTAVAFDDAAADTTVMVPWMPEAS